MRLSKSVPLLLFFVLLALSLSPVFAGGLSGFVDVHVPLPRLRLPNTTQVGGGMSLVNSSAGGVLTHPNTSLPPPVVGRPVATGSFSLADWVYLLVFGVFVGLSILMVFRRTPGEVYDISSAIRGLEEASRRFSTSYGSAKLNALVEYYRRLREVCSEFGLVEEASEAPSEFLDRVAATLGVDRRDARVFAEVFSRARYSQGVSGEEEASSSRFMAHFLDAVRERVGLGSKT